MQIFCPICISCINSSFSHCLIFIYIFFITDLTSLINTHITYNYCPVRQFSKNYTILGHNNHTPIYTIRTSSTLVICYSSNTVGQINSISINKIIHLSILKKILCTHWIVGNVLVFIHLYVWNWCEWDRHVRCCNCCLIVHRKEVKVKVQESLCKTSTVCINCGVAWKHTRFQIQNSTVYRTCRWPWEGNQVNFGKK